MFIKQNIKMSIYEKNIFNANIAELCERYEDMKEYLEDKIKSSERDLTHDERNLLSLAYMINFNTRRQALKKIISILIKEQKKENSLFIPSILEYKARVTNELTTLCKSIIFIVDNYLIKRAENVKDKVYYLKVRSNYLSHMAEFTEEASIAIEALHSFEQANELAKLLSCIHPLVLGLTLNLADFYFDVMKDKQNACKVVEEALDNAEVELIDIDRDDESMRDSLSIIDLLKTNLKKWKWLD
jgi:hypothetical protein